MFRPTSTIFPVLITLSGTLSTAAGHEHPEPALPDAAIQVARPMLLVDAETNPEMTVGWSARGEPVELVDVRPFSSPDDVVLFEGTNLAGSVSLGGTRLRSGAGHPNGAILRVEIRKVEERRALFAGVEPGSSFTLEVRGVRFNQPVRVEEQTALMHLRYSSADVQACALPPSASSQFLLADPRDTLGGMVAAGINATPGGLSGADGLGRVNAFIDGDGLVTLSVEVPYGLLRHLQDPWESDLPGTFFEPIRLHAEVEVLPAWAESIERDHPPLDEPVVLPTLDDAPVDD
ncbi:MAG: hypothetical protein AB8F26_05340 [Phycisphaerales bacterium]